MTRRLCCGKRLCQELALERLGPSATLCAKLSNLLAPHCARHIAIQLTHVLCMMPLQHTPLTASKCYQAVTCTSYKRSVYLIKPQASLTRSWQERTLKHTCTNWLADLIHATIHVARGGIMVIIFFNIFSVAWPAGKTMLKQTEQLRIVM